MNEVNFSFDRLIAPISRSSFLKDYYEAAPLVVHRADADYYTDVLTLDDVWHYLETQSPGADDIRLVKFDSDQQPTDHLGPNRRVDPVRVAGLFQEGWTIGLNGMQAYMPALAQLCAAAEAAFSAPFQANLYLTPPDAQGFKPHWDTHDVFVLQLHGSKVWTLYDTQIELPLVGQSFDEHKPEPGPVSAAFTLHAGDLLYCPRGLMHAAHAGPETSLHITFGVMATTWAELLVEAMSKTVLTDPSLRRNLPFGFAQYDYNRNEAAAQFSRLVATFAEKADFGAMFEHMREKFIGTRLIHRPGYVRELGRLDAISLATRVGVRPDLAWFVDGDDDAVRLHCGASTLTLPGFVRGALEVAMASADFVVGDLPGPLDDAGKATLVRRMIREGFLRTV